MTDPGRTFCGKCHKEFADIWALKRHYAECLRPQPQPQPLPTP